MLMVLGLIGNRETVVVVMKMFHLESRRSPFHAQALTGFGHQFGVVTKLLQTH